MNPKVSIIIPVRNGGNLICGMLDSILEQSMSDFEVIIVENGSTDNTVEVIKEYQSRDNRIQLVLGDKDGVSAARNTGIGLAKGKYMMFLDADDFIEKDYLESFIDEVESENDLVMSAAGYKAIRDDKVFYESPKVDETYSSDGFMDRLFKLQHYQGYVWNKLFLSSIIFDNNLCFDEEIFYNEDRLFLVQYLEKAKNGNVKMFGKNGYHYILREGNATSAEKSLLPTDRELTEINAFFKMLEIIKGNEKAYKRCSENCVERLILLFLRACNNKDAYIYKDSNLRNFAKQAMDLSFMPRFSYEKVAYKDLRSFADTGRAYDVIPGLKLFLYNRKLYLSRE